MVVSGGMDVHELRYMLVEVGANKLESMLSEHKAKNHEAAHYYEGAFHALKEAASSLFGFDPDSFRSHCMFEVTCLRLDAQAGNTYKQIFTDEE